jgi:hypothetical protein
MTYFIETRLISFHCSGISKWSNKWKSDSKNLEKEFYSYIAKSPNILSCARDFLELAVPHSLFS